jgi:hypothetical protein
MSPREQAAAAKKGTQWAALFRLERVIAVQAVERSGKQFN